MTDGNWGENNISASHATRTGGAKKMGIIRTTETQTSLKLEWLVITDN